MLLLLLTYYVMSVHAITLVATNRMPGSPTRKRKTLLAMSMTGLAEMGVVSQKIALSRPNRLAWQAHDPGTGSVPYTPGCR